MRQLFLILTFMGLFNAPLFSKPSLSNENHENKEIYFYEEEEIRDAIFFTKSAILSPVSLSNSKPYVIYGMKEFEKGKFNIYNISNSDCEGGGYNCTAINICSEKYLDVDEKALNLLEKKHEFKKNRISISYTVDYKKIDGADKLVIQGYQFCQSINIKNGLSSVGINKAILEFTNIAEEVLKISYPFKADKIVK